MAPKNDGRFQNAAWLINPLAPSRRRTVASDTPKHSASLLPRFFPNPHHPVINAASDAWPTYPESFPTPPSFDPELIQTVIAPQIALQNLDQTKPLALRHHRLQNARPAKHTDIKIIHQKQNADDQAPLVEQKPDDAHADRLQLKAKHQSPVEPTLATNPRETLPVLLLP